MNLNKHFAPEGIHKSLRPYSSPQESYEFVKAGFKADLMANEACMNKCNLDLSGGGALSALEKDCLRQCNVKLNDCKLLVDYELKYFARGIPI